MIILLQLHCGTLKDARLLLAMLRPAPVEQRWLRGFPQCTKILRDGLGHWLPTQQPAVAIRIRLCQPDLLVGSAHLVVPLTLNYGRDIRAGEQLASCSDMAAFFLASSLGVVRGSAAPDAVRRSSGNLSTVGEGRLAGR